MESSLIEIISSAVKREIRLQFGSVQLSRNNKPQSMKWNYLVGWVEVIFSLKQSKLKNSAVVKRHRLTCFRHFSVIASTGSPTNHISLHPFFISREMKEQAK